MIEDLEEALNPIRLQNKYDAYANQLKDRMKEGAYQLMIGTRWAVTDIQGRIEEQYRDNPRYRFRVIPALDENGKSNFEYPYGLGFSTKYYMDMKDSIDDATWCAKYLGRPTKERVCCFHKTNSIIIMVHFRTVIRIELWLQLMSRGVVIVCLCLSGIFMMITAIFMMLYSIMVIRPSLDQTVVAKLKQHRPHMTRVEANNGGDEFCDKVDELLKADGFRLNISHRKAPSTMSKLSRIIQVAPEIKVLF